jgi:hypothetical protein
MTKAAQRDGDLTVERKYIQKGSATDGPVTIPANDDVANHEEFWKRRLEDSSMRSMEAGLRNLPDHALRNLAIRQRNRLAGTHQKPEVNSESRRLGSDDVSLLAQVRLMVAAEFPELKTHSAEFNRIVAEAMREANS